jgi:hypothetical protein
LELWKEIVLIQKHLEVLELRGVKILSFSFPHSHKREDVQKEIYKFMQIFNVSMEEVEKVRN